MSGTCRRAHQFGAMSPVAVAMMVDRRLLNSWPFEITKGGFAAVRTAPAQNVWRRALLGDASGLTGVAAPLQSGTTLAPEPLERGAGAAPAPR